ncbi:hypothetical protein P7C71_g1071, partial [Lecanoromycetidae sp. Uapishka_2]
MAELHWIPLDSEQSKLLRQAAVAGNTERPAAMVSNQDMDLNALHGDGLEGSTLLHTAAAHGQLETILFLLDHGVAVDILDRDQFGCATPLYYAARKTQIEAAQVLLDAGADINARGPSDNTVGSAVIPVTMKVTNACITLMNLLLDRGFDVNTRASTYGPSVLEQAIKAESYSMIQILLDRGANLTGSIHIAVEFHKSVDTVNFLIDRGAKDPDFETLTRAACWNKVETAKVLLARSSEITSITNPVNALPMAARMGHSNMVGLLLDYGLKVDCVDDVGQTPLIAACGADRPSYDIVHLLIRRGASVNAKTLGGLYQAGGPYQAGDSPLHAAAWRSHPNTVQELLHAGADVTSRNNRGDTPLIKFADNINGPFIRLSEASPSPRLDTFRLLLEAGSDVNARDLQGRTALHHIAANHFADRESNRFKAAEMLLVKGIDLAVRDSNGQAAADLLRPMDTQLRHLMENEAQVRGTL